MSYATYYRQGWHNYTPLATLKFVLLPPQPTNSWQQLRNWQFYKTYGMDIHWFWGTWTSKMRIQTRNSFPEQCGRTQINISHRSHCSNPPQHGEIQHNEPRTLGCVDAKKKGPTLRLNWIIHQYCWNRYTLVLHFWYKLVMIGTKSISFANLLQHWGDEQPTKDHHWIIWGRPAGHWPLDRTKW